MNQTNLKFIPMTSSLSLRAGEGEFFGSARYRKLLYYVVAVNLQPRKEKKNRVI